MQNGLTRALRLIAELRKFDEMMPANHAAALIIIAKQEGLTQMEIGRRSDNSKSGIQRTFDKLADKGINGREGLNLIEVREGSDRRERLAYLTPKGRQLINSIHSLMAD